MNDRKSEELIEALEEVLGSHLSGSAPMRRLARAVGSWLVAQADLAENAEFPEKNTSEPPPAEPSLPGDGLATSAPPPLGGDGLPPSPAIVGPQIVTPAPTQDVPLRL
ncbi:hypothetical protein MNBD_PLANCTO03-1767, partial [hydrothermal vent metagenome]